MPFFFITFSALRQQGRRGGGGAEGKMPKAWRVLVARPTGPAINL